MRKHKKRCSVCGDESPELGFASSGYCVPCNREYAKKNYEENKDRYKDAARKRTRMIKEEVNKLKNGPCVDCGVSYPHYVMDFDHIGTDKTLAVSVMIKRHFSFRTILEEIEKCELVCSNCHRERTAQRYLEGRDVVYGT